MLSRVYFHAEPTSQKVPNVRGSTCWLNWLCSAHEKRTFCMLKLFGLKCWKVKLWDDEKLQVELILELAMASVKLILNNEKKKSVMVNGCSSLNRENLVSYAYVYAMRAQSHAHSHCPRRQRRAEKESQWKIWCRSFAGKIYSSMTQIASLALLLCKLHVCIHFAHEVRNTKPPSPTARLG